MKTKLDYYKIFYETARFSSFSLAAKHLYISQSAISQCIGQLEKDLNTQLFIRSRRGVTLTKEGKLLFDAVESAIQSIEQGETILSRLQHLESGSLFIAAGDSITTHFLLPYLELFHKTYPDVKIEMANSYSHQMLDLVKEGKADLAFVNLPIEDDELTIKPCFEIHDVFVCGDNYPCKNSYSWKDISKEALILLETNSSSRQFIDKQFNLKNIILEPQFEFAVHDLLIRFASIHMGVSCVVKEFSKESLDKGIIKEMNISPPLPVRNIGYAHLKHSPLPLPAKAFLELINEKKDIR